MRLAEFSQHNPAAVAAAAAIVMLFGVLALLRLPIQLLPDTRRPELFVNASWREAAPAELEEALIEPIEEAMRGLPGLVEMRSEANRGRGGVRLTFEVGTDMTRVMLDVRTAGESKQSLLAFVERLAGDQPYTVTDAWCSEPTPLAADSEKIYGYDTAADSEVVLRAREAIGAGMGRQPELISYQFATDGRHFVPYGIAIIGYAPGDERQAHTAGESIAISQMEEALRGYVQLLLDF